MSKGIKAEKLKGFQDFLPEKMLRKREIITAVIESGRLCGFQEVDSPVLEYAETLLGEGGETDKQIYRFHDNGGRDIALRFDLTMPFARMIAENHGILTFPFKRMQIGSAWRAEKPQKGRYRQFTQGDFDIIGPRTAAADQEVLAVIQRVLGQVLPHPTTMRVGHREVLSALIAACFGPVVDEGPILIALDKLDKIGSEKVVGMLKDLGYEQGADLVELIDASDRKTVEAKLADNTEAISAVEQLWQVVEATQSSAAEGSKVVADLSIARGLAYYTGVVFETTIDALPKFGSISSGGRYDDLVGRFGKQALAGVGGSVGVDRLLAALEELEVPSKQETPQVFVAMIGAPARAWGWELCQRLRNQSVRTEIDLTSKKPAHQFRHAARLNIPLVLTVGEQEQQQGTFHLKDMASGAEARDIPESDLETSIREALEAVGDFCP